MDLTDYEHYHVRKVHNNKNASMNCSLLSLMDMVMDGTSVPQARDRTG